MRLILLRHLLPLLLALPCSCLAQIPAAPLLWLRADSGVVRSASGDSVLRWRDVSGHGNDAIPPAPPASPSYLADGAGGRPAVRFDGNARILRCPDIFPVNSGYTKIVVARINDFMAFNNLVSGTKGHGFLLGRDTHPRLFQSGTDFTVSYTPASGKWSIFSGLFRASDRLGRVFVDGVYGGSGSADTGNTDSTLFIGGFGGSYVLAGDISEVLVYPRELSPAERDSVERYLSEKYDIRLRPELPSFPFTRFPAPLQFYPRDGDDSAVVEIAGTKPFGLYDSVRVDLYRDGIYWRSASQPLEWREPSPFTLRPKIAAGAFEYGVRVYLIAGLLPRLIGARDSIVCGDVIMIAGQSNSTPGFTGATDRNEFCRTFGAQAGRTLYDDGDTVWGLSSASAPGFQGHLHVGVWGVRLQRLILERFGMPTCVITGGVSGSTIEMNQRNDARPEDPATIYGRTLYRARKAGIAGSVRALFWYQGESNGIDGYYHNFRSLYDDWHADYPGIEKIYTIQIRPGCYGPPSHGELRELQRTLTDSLPGVTPVSVTSVPGHDGCHYSAAGYDTLAGQLFRLLARDFYPTDDTIGVDSPSPRYAYYTSSARDEIEIVYRSSDTLIWPEPLDQDSVVRRMEDLFLLDGAAGAVRKGSAEGNRVRLELAAPSEAIRLTYIPSLFYPGTAVIAEGPWITNSRGIGALTFNEIPIFDSPIAAHGGAPLESTMPEIRVGEIVPNPFSDKTRIHLLVNVERQLTADIYDVLGRPVRSYTERLSPGARQLVIAGEGLPSGLYHCIIRFGARTTRIPLVITH